MLTPTGLRLATAALLPLLAAHAGLPHRVALIDPADAASLALTPGTAVREFTTAEIDAKDLPATAPERRVLSHTNLIRAHFAGLDPQARYEARLSFFTDDDRTVHLHAGPVALFTDLKIKPHTPLTHTVEIPAQAYADGTLRLALTDESGNPVVSRIEILASHPGSLAPAPAPAAALAAATLPLPRLTPRPESVADIATPRVSLDGAWRFRTAADAPEADIAVPGEWAMQGFTVAPGAEAVYRKDFTPPSDRTGKRIKLRFDAVSAECRVRVNGRPVGAHAGGFVPFECDITEALKPGAGNTLEVLVRHDTPADTLATMSQYAAHPVGGLLRSVSLFAVPEVHLASVDVRTAFDAAYRDATLTVSARLANEGAAPADAELVATLLDPDGRPVELGSAATATVAKIPERASRAVELTLPVPAARAWDTEHPRLYTLRLAVVRDGKTLATTVQRVGLRTVALDGARLLLNGKPVKLLGACRHEIDPLTGRSITAAQCRRDAELFRAGNANFIRTSHYPPSEAFLDACDELGLLVEAEAAVCWVKHDANRAWKRRDHEDPAFFEPIARANLDNLVAHRAHPSVILWSLANESRWSPVFARVDAIMREADPTRPTVFHDQCWGAYNNAGSRAQIAVFHYPGEDGPALCDKTADRPTYFGEYAHVQCYNRREWHTDPFVRADWGRPLARMVDAMWEHPNCLGGAIWSGIDDLFHLPEALGGDLVGYGPWGVIDGWRREKPEYAGMKNAYARVRIEGPVSLKDGVWRLRLRNRYDFANLAEVGIAWRCGGQSGTVRAEAAPHTGADIVIRPGEPPAPGEPLRLTLTDPRGFVILEREYGARPPAPPSRPASPVRLVESATEYTATNAHTTVRLRRDTGALTLTDAAGATLLTGLPAPAIIGLNGEGGASGPAGSVFANNLSPFTPVDTTWKTTSVSALRAPDDAVKFEITGANKDASGAITLLVRADGALSFAYALTSNREVNPRQRGLAFELPREFDTLAWLRATDEASCDPHDIARKRGTAKANPASSPLVFRPRVRPDNPWALDTSPLGTNDFRSTKAGLLAASLTDPSGAGLELTSDGSQAARAWVDGDRVRLLVTDFNTGGCDGFFNPHYAAERRPMKKGDKWAGTVTLRPARTR